MPSNEGFILNPCSVRRYDFSADIWSFGITLYEVSTGKAPLANMSLTQVILTTVHDEAPVLPNKNGRKYSDVSVSVKSLLHLHFIQSSQLQHKNTGDVVSMRLPSDLPKALSLLIDVIDIARNWLSTEASCAKISACVNECCNQAGFKDNHIHVFHLSNMGIAAHVCNTVCQVSAIPYSGRVAVCANFGRHSKVIHLKTVLALVQRTAC